MNRDEVLQEIERAAFEEATVLDLSGNELTELPPELGNLNQLRELDLSDNKLTDLPPELGNLTELRNLDLNSNQLRALPPELGNLRQLQELNLMYNQLRELPSEVVNLTQLEVLYLEGNRLTEWLSELVNLTQLTSLDLADNWLTELPSEVVNLTQLEVLYLEKNQLTALPPELGNLSQLQYLNLSGNQLRELPSELGNLSQLRSLLLSGNKLTDLPPELGNLTELQNLDLESNQLRELPPELGNLSQLQFLDFTDNQLPIPLEILKDTKNPARIINYYLQLLGGEQRRPLNEAKMLIVGQGGVGKTSLVNQLIHGEFNPNENKTEGIDIQRWNVNAAGTDIQLNVWDFGGQEIMHATHQFFLTKRSLYILVLDARQGENESRIEYWLKLIQSFGGDSPIIVVSNKSDQHELDLDWTGLQRKYPAIKNYAKKVSCDTGEGIEELREMIEHEVAQLEHIRDELVSSWFEIKTTLEKMKEDSISYERYQELCEAQGIDGELNQSSLVSLLHDLGVVLHFHDHPILGSTNILNPEWVTNGVYQILNSNQLFQKKGILDVSDLTQILKPRHSYPKNKHSVITSIMQQFELCFEFPETSGKQFLVPDLLQQDGQYTGDWEECLEFEYHYDVLPTSVISRFIVRMSDLIKDKTYWRNGVVLESEDKAAVALVRADHEDKKIFISVLAYDGYEDRLRPFLESIRAQLHKIHKTIARIEPEGKVPIPGHPEVPPVDYEHLLDLEEMGEETFVPQGLGERVSVKGLLEGVEDVDLPMLARELGDVTTQLRAEGGRTEHSAEIRLIEEAQRAAQQGQRRKTRELLSKVGGITLEVATKIGAEVAAAWMKSGMGL